MVQDYTHQIAKLHFERHYRPVVVAVLYRTLDCSCSSIKILAVQSAKALKNDSIEEWLFPQEGIEEGETIIETLKRGLQEELSLQSSQYASGLHDKLVFHYETLNAPSSRKDKRGYSAGKAYFFVPVWLHEQANIIPKEDEILNPTWFDIVSLQEKLKHDRPEKTAMYYTALRKLSTIIRTED